MYGGDQAAFSDRRRTDQTSTQEPQKVWTWLARVIGMRQYHGRSDVRPDIGMVVFPIRGVGYGGSLVAIGKIAKMRPAEMRTLHPHTICMA